MIAWRKGKCLKYKIHMSSRHTCMKQYIPNIPKCLKNNINMFKKTMEGFWFCKPVNVKFEELAPNPPLLVLSAFSPIPFLMTKHDFEVKCYESKKTIQTFVDGGTNVLWIQWILGLPSMGNWAIMGVPIHLLNNVPT